MNDIDEKIKQALSEEDAATIAEIDEQAGIFELIGMTLRGKQAWLTYYMWFLGLGTFCFAIFALNRFLGSDDTSTQLGWMLAINFSLAMFVIIKVIGWLQMTKLETLREIKRLEMRLLLDK